MNIPTVIDHLEKLTSLAKDLSGTAEHYLEPFLIPHDIREESNSEPPFDGSPVAIRLSRVAFFIELYLGDIRRTIEAIDVEQVQPQKTNATGRI